MTSFEEQLKIPSPGNINTPTLVFDDKIPWQMSRWERYALKEVLMSLKPRVSIEIGTYKGGSLSLLSNYSSKVYSIDVDPNIQNDLFGKYKNVKFICGRSADVLPNILPELDFHGTNFVLVDGDHSADGVCEDITHILNAKNFSHTVIFMHDSFNSECRNGILKAPWSENKRVSFVEIDFVPGALHQNGYDQALPMSMWGGFACAVILPEERQYDLVISQSQQELFNAAFERLGDKK